MVDRKDPMSVKHQCALLDLPRSTFYHQPKPVSDRELGLMTLIDRCHLDHPFYGSRRIRDWLEDESHSVSRKRVQRLMRTMGLAAYYPKRNLSLANHAHKVYPYLEEPRDRPAESGVGDGYHLHSDGPGVRVSCRHYRLVFSACPVMASIQYTGYPILYRRPRGGH